MIKFLAGIIKRAFADIVKLPRGTDPLEAAMQPIILTLCFPAAFVSILLFALLVFTRCFGIQ
jgi:hypothetical protein